MPVEYDITADPPAPCLPMNINLIYEAAVVSEKWPLVLESIAQETGGAFAAVLSVSPSVHVCVASGEGHALFQDSVRQGMDYNARIDRLLRLVHPGFLTDNDLFEPTEMVSEPLYRDFLYPRGYGWFAGTLIEVPHVGTYEIGIERRFKDGPIGPDHIRYLNRLRPHLTRAVMIAATLGANRAEKLQDVFETLQRPAAILSQAGHVCAANAQFVEKGRGLFQAGAARVTLLDAKADAMLARALAAPPRTAAEAALSLVARDFETQEPHLLHLVPISGAANDIFAPGKFMLMLTSESRASLSPQTLMDLFSLTPAEARVAKGLAEGWSVEELSQQFGSTKGTLRTQVKRVLAKTGTERQAQLVALIARFSGC